ncbi:Hypothetical predicted protein, partial [Paramuricea clavata]
MASCMDKENKRVSDMTVAELKEYLKMRGITASGYLKPASLQIAQEVEKMMLPIDPNHEYGNSDLRNAIETLIIHDIVIRQPLSYPVVNRLNDFIDSPPFS